MNEAMRLIDPMALIGGYAERPMLVPTMGRPLHLHAPKGKRHRSLKERSNRRKAARKARHRR